MSDNEGVTYFSLSFEPANVTGTRTKEEYEEMLRCALGDESVKVIDVKKKCDVSTCHKEVPTIQMCYICGKKYDICIECVGNETSDVNICPTGYGCRE